VFRNHELTEKSIKEASRHVQEVLSEASETKVHINDILRRHNKTMNEMDERIEYRNKLYLKKKNDK